MHQYLRPSSSFIPIKNFDKGTKFPGKVTSEFKSPLNDNMAAGKSNISVVLPKIFEDSSFKSEEANVATHNHSLSDRLPLDRRVPDTRPQACRDIPDSAIPDGVRVSVVIAHRNERRATLLRTVASVMRQTPARLLHSVVLVDDASDTPFQPTDETPIPRLLQLRNEQKIGVTASRARGAAAGSGSSHIVFLDSLCPNNDAYSPLWESS
ncbi:polypeptide N-acetylgalactosaminyltransferase 16-like [Hyalella azteca]|uniref:Polypeptide N-acetylgalactosaminyltransferase 16-like n=1 Tax=Hyalella azteca TaxID=294128 RepID=A0A8B7P942_HYAAZ|nr:polypeptide N-acetylgalactosaminyltransferase 16-like [Hyalella azteca]